MKRQKGFFCFVIDRMLGKAILVSLLVLLTNVAVRAQHEADNWFFGTNAGLSFTTGSPVALAGSAMTTNEGSAVISDQTGALLFYTDGKTVWNKNHQVMTNGTGLFGSDSATQSAIIVPWPGTECKKYFIFTVPGAEDKVNLGLAPSLHYSVVELNTTNPLGIVVSKNVFLKNPVSEKLTAVADSAGTGFWAIVHGFDMGNANSAVNREFYAYHITASGLNTSPVTSTQGSAHFAQSMAPGNGALGQMKVSPDGKLIAHGVRSRFAEVLNFHTNNGTVTGPATTIDATLPPFTTSYVYGIEFSPNSKLLYVSTSGLFPNQVIQFDLSTITPTPTVLSIPNASGSANYDTAALQLGPDKKIYVARVNGSSISVISSPDNACASNACNFTTGPALPSGTISRLGLPTIIVGNFSCAPTPTPTPTPQECCDRLAAVPHPQPEQTIDYRGFTITNLKAPVSPICSVDINFSPSVAHQGGQLAINGGLLPITPFRFVSPYNRIPNANGLTISATNTVQFNLGVDWTIGWTGNVTFVVHHCDGTTCTLTYGPWAALPPSPPPDPNVYDSTLRVEGNLHVLSFQLKPRARRPPIKWISFMLADGKGQIFAGSGSSASEGRERSAPTAVVEDTITNRSSVLYAFVPPLKSGEASGTFDLVLRRDANAPGAPVIIWTTYDPNGNAVERGTITSRRGTP